MDEASGNSMFQLYKFYERIYQHLMSEYMHVKTSSSHSRTKSFNIDEILRVPFRRTTTGSQVQLLISRLSEARWLCGSWSTSWGASTNCATIAKRQRCHSSSSGSGTATSFCKYCGKSFTRPWLLQGHVRTHTGERPFRCGECGKTFADKSNLRAHVQTHSTLKPFQCSKCSRCFSLKSYLAKHKASSCDKKSRQLPSSKPN